jgi:hypothetical protein
MQLFSVSMKRAPSKPLTVSAKQVNKDRLEALDAQYDWHLKAEEESNKPERQHGNMENLPWVLLAIVLALIASLAVEIVRKATPECPAGTVTHHPGERAAMRRQGTGTLAHNPCAMRPRIAAFRQRSSISRCNSSYSRRLIWYSRSTSSSRESHGSSSPPPSLLLGGLVIAWWHYA